MKPIITFVTCSKCKHCKDFRGESGKPSDDNSWNNTLIRKLLTKNGVLRCSRIINIHDERFGANVDNINEFNMYNVLPYNIKIEEDFFKELMYDDVPFIGDMILRTSITRNIDNTIDISVELNGNCTDPRCEKIKKQAEEYFIWNHIPIEFKEFKDFFYGSRVKSIEDIFTEGLREDEYYDIIIRNFNHYQFQPEEFETLLRRRYDYNWFIDNFFPKRLRELESFYPSWILVLPSEWAKGICTDNSVYGKVMLCETNLVGKRFVSRKVEKDTIFELLDKYSQGKIDLTYEDAFLRKSNMQKLKFSIDN